MTARRLLQFAVCAWLIGSGTAAAIDLRNVLTGYTVASWTAKDGLPANVVRTIVQDLKGYLWIGTDAGLFRFDGVKFVAWQALHPGAPLPRAPVRTPRVSRDGSLWIGFADTGALVQLTAEGGVRTFDAPTTRLGTITAISEQPDGSILVGAFGGLYTVAGDRLARLAPQDGLPDEPVSALYVDKQSNLYVCTAAGVVLRHHGQPVFTKVDSRGDVLGLAEDPFGRIWTTNRTVGFSLLGSPANLDSEVEEARGIRLMSDSKGFLWIATNGQGAWRVRLGAVADTPTIDRMTAMTGLASDDLSSVLEDRDGNIWLGSSEGLNRLTAHKVTAVTNLGLVGGVQATADGDIWVTTTSDVIRYRSGDPGLKAQRVTLGDARIHAIQTDGHGVWVSTSRGLFRAAPRGSGISAAGPTSGGADALLAADRHGTLWSYDRRLGLCRWTAGTCGSMAEVPRAAANAVFADRDDCIWILFADGAVGRLDPQTGFRMFDERDGLDAGAYYVAFQDRSGVVWLGGSNGLSRFSQARFATVQRAEGFRWWVRAIAEDAGGRFWLGTDLGIVFVTRSELDKAFAQKGYLVQHGLYNVSDGVGGVSVVGVGNKGSALGDRGLWFVTSLGATVVNPRLTSPSLTRYPVMVEDITADHEVFGARSGIVLPAGTSRIVINYTTLNLTSPLKTHFRYRLEGFDDDWVDVGNRRQAVYTNLPPRNYKLRVVSDADDGTWIEPGDVLDFSIRPAFYQTLWFATVCAVGLIGAVAGVWRLKVRQFRSKYEATLRERSRISREIHDTLLQSVVGLSLKCEVLASDIADSAPVAGSQLVAMRRELEDYIREARESIWKLRSTRPDVADLAHRLRVVAERAAVGGLRSLDVSVTGARRECPAPVCDQLARISQEAVANAVRHGRADQVRLELAYERKHVTLKVSDNGCGFDPDALHLEMNGHYGLATMRERAESLGGVLRIASKAGGGTEIEARLPLTGHHAA